MKLAEQALFAGMIAIVATFFSRQFGAELSRSVVFLFFPLSFLALICGRYIALALQHRMLTRGVQVERVAIVGHGDHALRIAQAIRNAGPGSELVGIIPTREFQGRDLTVSEPIIGTMQTLAHAIKTSALDRLVISGRDVAEEDLDACFAISGKYAAAVTCPLRR